MTGAGIIESAEASTRFLVGALALNDPGIRAAVVGSVGPGADARASYQGAGERVANAYGPDSLEVRALIRLVVGALATQGMPS